MTVFSPVVMHRVVGMDQSGHIISINTDPNADIFEASDVIAVEDFRKMVPMLTEETKIQVTRITRTPKTQRRLSWQT